MVIYDMGVYLNTAYDSAVAAEKSIMHPERHLPAAVESIVEALICLPDLDIDQVVPCPFSEVGMCIGLVPRHRVVRGIVAEIKDAIARDVDERLEKYKLGNLFDIVAKPGGFIHLTGERNAGERPYCRHCTAHRSTSVNIPLR